MACPYFEPVEVCEPPSIRRVTLGEMYSGRCMRGGVGVVELCNEGYARGRCEHLPGGDAVPDAHRYSIAGQCEGRIELTWIVEKDHRPERFGTSLYVIQEARFEPPVPHEMAGQAAAFVASYLRGRASQGRQADAARLHHSARG